MADLLQFFIFHKVNIYFNESSGVESRLFIRERESNSIEVKFTSNQDNHHSPVSAIKQFYSIITTL